MNISFAHNRASERHFGWSQEDGAELADAAQHGVGELEFEQNPIGHLANDTATDKLNEARDGSVEVPGHGKAGKALAEGSALGDVSGAFRRDILGEAEALANGDAGTMVPGPSTHERLGSAIERAAGAVSEGESKSGTLACALVGFFASVLSRGLGGRPSGVGPAIALASMVSLAMDVAKSDASKEQQNAPAEGGAEGKSDGSEPSSCDPTNQSCPGPTGMGDDPENQANQGDPILNGLELARRANDGDCRAAGVVAARSGSAGAVAPAWAKNDDARDGQGKASHDGDALLRGISRIDIIRALEDESDPAGVRPPIDFGQMLADRERDLIFRPLPI